MKNATQARADQPGAETVSIQVNQQALLKNLKFAFSNSFTVVSELLQNGRRAGATAIDIQFFKDGDDDVLVVTDNGMGITDFQKLLTVAESGWGEDVVANESPYGMGFLSALFSARRVVVESNGRTLDMDTEHMLSMSDVQIMPVSEFTGPGVRVSLHGVQKLQSATFQELVMGFPLPVSLNGQLLAREHALDGDFSFEDTEFGALYLNYPKALMSARHGVYDYVLYLQGFKVAREHGKPDFLLHLDSTKFFGRLPDRDNLVDHQEVVSTVKAFITQKVRAWCEAMLTEMGADAFCLHYGEQAFAAFPELLLKLDFLPKQILRKPETLSQNSYRATKVSFGRHVSKAELESGKVQVFSDIDYLDVDSGNVLVWQWMEAYEHAALLDLSLPEGHWAIPFLLNETTDGQFDVEIVNPGKSGDVSGEYLRDKVQLCEKVVVSFNGAELSVTSFALYDAKQGILVPDGASYAGFLAEVIVNYTDEYDGFDENTRENDADEIDNTVTLLRTQDFCKGIRGELGKLAFLDGIEGQHFVVAFSSSPDGKWGARNVEAVELAKVLAKLNISDEAFKAATQAVITEMNPAEGN